MMWCWFAVLCLVSNAGTANGNFKIQYKFVTSFNWLYNDAGTGAKTDFSIWRPTDTETGYFALGDVAMSSHSKPTKGIMVKTIESGALIQPTGSVEIWNDRGSEGRNKVRIMQLTAPSGYICLGNVAVGNYDDQPNYNLYRCVKQQYITNGAYSQIWKDVGSGATLDFSAWRLERSSSSIYGFSPNLFKSHASHSNLPCCASVPDARYFLQASNSYSEYPNCKLDNVGRGYAGIQQVTKSRKVCRPWADMTHAQKNSLSCASSPLLEDYYCRNCNGKSEGPWCYTGTGVNDWEACDINICKSSATCTASNSGIRYVGTRSMTISGRPCQRWSAQSPHAHSYTNANMFPDSSVEDAGNNCRNPSGSRSKLWCYTTDSTKEWEYCDVPVCSDCKQTVLGKGYSGNKAQSAEGLTCERWSNSPLTDSNLFPDASVADASNYCRNPDGDSNGLWCYVRKGGQLVKSNCGVPLCKEDCDKDSQQKRTTKHVLHFGIDGLHSTCWQNAPGGAPNFKKLVTEGVSTFTNARAELITNSGPNWGAHLCGMGIPLTGILANSWSPPWLGNSAAITPVNGRSYPMPCAFNYLKGMDSNIRTAAFYNWAWISNLSNGGIPGSTNLEYQPPAGYAAGDSNLIPKAAEYIKKTVDAAEKSYTFVHIDQVDGAGHSSSWCSSSYLQAVANADALLAKLLEAIEGKPVLLIVSSDHGGDNGHGHMRDSNVLIPMWVRGPGVKKNYKIAGQVRNKDILPTAAWALGLKGSSFWDGQVMYEIFE